MSGFWGAVLLARLFCFGYKRIFHNAEGSFDPQKMLLRGTTPHVA
jgi:hypothetical protein